MGLQKKLVAEVVVGIKLKQISYNTNRTQHRLTFDFAQGITRLGQTSLRASNRNLRQEQRQNLMKMIRNFHTQNKLRRVITYTTREGPREVLMRSIRERGVSGLRQVVGRHVADQVIPVVSHLYHLIWVSVKE